MGKIILSCGHTDCDHHNGWSVTTKDYGDFGEKTLVYGQLCSSCFSRLLDKEPYRLVSSGDQIIEWLEHHG